MCMFNNTRSCQIVAQYSFTHPTSQPQHLVFVVRLLKITTHYDLNYIALLAGVLEHLFYFFFNLRPFNFFLWKNTSCPFSVSLLGCLLVDMQKFCIYSRFYSSVSYRCCKYFLPVCASTFYFLMDLNLHIIKSINLFFHSYFIFVMPKEILLYLK